MKRLFAIAIILCSLSLPAFAAKNTQKVTFWQTTKVGSTQVPAGTYKVTWTGADSNLQVTINQGKKTVATAPAKLLPAKNLNVSVSTNTVNGVAVLQSIQLDNFNLIFTEAGSTGQ